MPGILIAGCGYVGQATADLFHDAGWIVQGWTKSSPPVVRPYRIESVDITDAEQVRQNRGDYDAVIHCASTRGGDVDFYRRVYLEGVRNLIDAFPRSRILFTSSTSVYAQAGGEWVTEKSETKPTRPSSQILIEAEELVLGNDGIVARLGGIYGPGRSALLDKFLKGEVGFESDYYVNQVHRDDIAAALILLLTDSGAKPGVYNVTDGEPILISECYRWLARTLDLSRLPSKQSASTSTRKRGNTNKRVENAKLRGLGWSPRYPTFAEGMEKSVLPSRDRGAN